MKQQEFLWMSNNIQPEGGVIQGTNSEIIVNLRNGIQITHNYKKNNLMCIRFTEDQTIFRIPSEKELKEIYRMHLGNVNLMIELRKYCDDHLEML